ncbi:MAG: glutathione peroxidase [Bacteroidota bacterium]
MLTFLRSLFTAPGPVPASIYDFKVKALDGSTIDFSHFRGKKILLVNTASRCGMTPQYEGLQKLYDNYRNKLVVVGFPSNNFLFQEPGTNEDIAAFCSTSYHVSFPMAAKISVIGWHMHPLYKWLTKKKHNGYASSTVKWNFQKYLVDEGGKLTNVFSPNVLPESPEIIAAIEG